MDNSLIKNIKKGDRKAFTQVFDNYYNALAAFAFKFIEDSDIAEDYAQEAFIKFWERRKDFEHINAVKSFLYTSVRNACLNHLKHEKVKKKHEPGLAFELESEQEFGSHVIREEVFNNLYNMIKELPGASQQIMLLALNGMKNQEIADELDVSINTVKTQKKIAYAKIKDKINPGMLQGMIFLCHMIFFSNFLHPFFKMVVLGMQRTI